MTDFNFAVTVYSEGAPILETEVTAPNKLQALDQVARQNPDTLDAGDDLDAIQIEPESSQR